MKYLPIISLSFFLIFPAIGNKEKIYPHIAIISIESGSNIKFDFVAKKMKDFPGTIEISGTLYNNDNDTVYFLSSTCDGMQYSLQYDTAKFHLTPFLNCNVNYPCIKKIPPKNKLDFVAHFKNKNQFSEIKLGFDLYTVDKTFDLKSLKGKRLDTYNRKEKNIIWSEIEKIE